MPTTLVQPLPYPAPGAVPDVPADLKLLAEAVETRVVMRFPSTAARDAALPVGQRVAGMHAWVDADSTLYIYRAGSWVAVERDSGWINGIPAGGVTGTIKVRRVGREVEVFYVLSGSIPAGGLVTVAFLPAGGYAPSHVASSGAFFPDSRAGSAIVNEAGELKVLHNAATGLGAVTGSVMYFLG